MMSDVTDSLVPIGDFSRMTHLTVKALRYYHDIGILQPAEVDAFSGYRRYHTAQLPLAQIIRRLRDLEMPVEEIREVVAAPDIDARNHAVAVHLERMERQLVETRRTVASLRAILTGPAPSEDVVYRAAPSTPSLAIHGSASLEEAGAWIGSALTELIALTDEFERVPDGPAGSLFSPELFEGGYGSLSAYLPVSAAHSLPRLGRAEPWTVPAAELAVMVHSGTHDDLDRTYAALGTAVSARGIAVSGPIRETFLVSALDTPDPAAHLTEVCWPVFQVAQAI